MGGLEELGHAEEDGRRLRRRQLVALFFFEGVGGGEVVGWGWLG